MKMRALFAFVMTVMLFALMSCKTSPKDMIVNKWKPTDITGPLITPEAKTKALAGDNSLEFKKDGKYINTTNGKADESGTYSLSDDGKTLTINPPGGSTQTVSIKELTKDKMVAVIMGQDFTFSAK